MLSLTMVIGEANPVVIMDNAPVHNGISNAFPETNIKFPLPYSPFLNPIENCFSVLKSDMKRSLNEEREKRISAEAARQGISVSRPR